jgi:flagellar hook protein FlgE
VGLETQGLVFPLMFVRPTTQVELQGNLSSSSATPIGVPFTKTQRIFDSMGTPHNLIFKFTRLPAGSDSDNEIQYSTEVTVEGGVVKRLDTTGAAIDATGSPMILTFNQSGQMNLCDYGQPTESNLPPKFYIEWYNPYILSAPLTIELNLGRGKGASPTTWEGALEPFAEGNLCAYDGNSLITYSHQDGTGMGKYESLSVSELGEVTAQYSCGMKHVGSLVYAKVPKPEGLEPIGNSFRISAASGMPVLFHK